MHGVVYPFGKHTHANSIDILLMHKHQWSLKALWLDIDIVS